MVDVVGVDLSFDAFGNDFMRVHSHSFVHDCRRGRGVYGRVLGVGEIDTVSGEVDGGIGVVDHVVWRSSRLGGRSAEVLDRLAVAGERVSTLVHGRAHSPRAGATILALPVLTRVTGWNGGSWNDVSGSTVTVADARTA